MGYAPTFEETCDEISQNNWKKAEYLKVTRSSGFHSTGYDLPFLKTGSDKIQTKPSYLLKTEGKNWATEEKLIKKEAIGRFQRKAIELSLQLEKTQDIFDQANISIELKRILKELWGLRNERENNWGDLINIIQAVFARTEVELLNKKQKKALRLVIIEYLCNSYVEDADMERAIIALSEDELDPWVGISGNSDLNDLSFLEG